VTVRALVANSSAALKPGMFLTVELAQDHRPAVSVPEEAVIPEQARQFVYVIDGKVVRKREVTLGRREPGFVEVVNGLSLGDHVVVEGTLKLRDGTPVSEVAPVIATADAPSS
jgi:membrane fusion protein (multidrug efflux system)